MLYCGICHTDVHHGRNEWGPGNFPIVAGHELLGKVTEVGDKVTKFKVRVFFLIYLDMYCVISGMFFILLRLEICVQLDASLILAKIA